MARRPDTSAPILRYTSAQLGAYVNDPNSGVRRVNEHIHIGLLPAALNNFKEAVIGAVNDAKVGRYDARLDGIVLDVRGIKVLGPQFAIHTDHPELHVELRADVHVFRPTVGASIRGVIKHIAKSHISVTVHRVFNVAIRLAAGVRRDGLAVNAEIAVRVTEFNLKDSIPYIAGVLDKEQPLVSALKTGKKAKSTTKLASDGSEEEEQSDPEDDNRSVLVDTRVIVKKEPISGSDHSDTETEPDDSEPDSQDETKKKTSAAKPTAAKATKKSAPVAAAANSFLFGEKSDSDSESEAEVPQPKREIKREKRVSSSSSSSSEEEQEVARFPTKSSVKREPPATPSKAVSSPSSSADSSDSEPAMPKPTKLIVKSEPNASVSASPAKRKSTAPSEASSAKRPAVSAVDALLQKLMKKSKRAADDEGAEQEEEPSTPVRSKKGKRATADNDTTALGDVTFATPGLSSTLLPGVRKSKSSKKAPKE